MVVQGRPCVRVDRRQLFPSLFLQLFLLLSFQYLDFSQTSVAMREVFFVSNAYASLSSYRRFL